MSVVSKTNTNFAAQLDTLESQHTKGEIRLAKLEAEIVDVTAELETLKIQVKSIEDKSMQILDIENSLKDTIIGYEQGISDVDTR